MKRNGNDDYLVAMVKGGTEAVTVEELSVVEVVRDVACLWVQEDRPAPKHKKSAEPIVVTRPRFPGYIFLRCWRMDDWPIAMGLVRTVRGVVLIRDRPARLREKELQMLMADIEKTEDTAVVNGDMVEITGGNFKGISGQFLNGNVHLTLLGREIGVEIPLRLLKRLC